MGAAAVSSGWFFLAVALAVVLILVRRSSQRRSAINQALHEIRRPLQAMALSAPLAPVSGRDAASFVGREPGTRPEPSSGIVWQAIRAVGELDRQLNGGGPVADQRELVACRLMVDACVRRWQPRARLSGAEIKLRWAGPDALVRGDGVALAAALENLLLNAIEHGGPLITVNALIVSKRLRIEVIDAGRLTEPCGSRFRRSAGGLRRPKRHGHGLAVVERTASIHGGRFDFSTGDAGATATLVLPVNQRGASRSAPVRADW